MHLDPLRSLKPLTPNYDATEEAVHAFRLQISAVKGEHRDFPWYSYETLSNFIHLEPLINAEVDQLFSSGKRFADIGAADGDLAFFMESRGNQCDIYDNPPTNMNGLKGARRMKAALKSSVGIVETDLDSQFKIEKRYDAVFFLGILYHLKNPFYVLEHLSSVSRYMFISTRVARFFKENNEDVSSVSAAYLVSHTELNNDATNFWVFSIAGFKQIVYRAGWDLIGFRTVGDTESSTPRDNDRDERAFAILKSR